MPSITRSTTPTTDPDQIAHFAKDSERWWDEEGPFAPLHRLNPVRMAYLRAQIGAVCGEGPDDLRPFQEMKILDIGCGGGLVSECLARMGAQVTGLDADSRAIGCARDHAALAGLSIAYEAASAETFLAQTGKAGSFDVVLALEILEHVADPAAFLACCAALVRPGGAVIVSTLHRTAKAFALGIVAAEHVLRWVPRGTHQWRRFVKPSEAARLGRACGLGVRDTTGLVFDPVRRVFRLSASDLDVNYFMVFTKTGKRGGP